MKNWSTRDDGFKTEEERIIWKLNQLINFGLGSEKLDLELVKKYWGRLFMDKGRESFLRLLLWE